jgi:hypothetical protein
MEGCRLDRSAWQDDRGPPSSIGVTNKDAIPLAPEAPSGTAGILKKDLRARLIVPLIVALAMLMETTDATVLATALPVLSKDLQVPVLSLNWRSRPT